MEFNGDDVGAFNEEGGIEGVGVDITFVSVAVVVGWLGGVSDGGSEIGFAECFDAIEVDDGSAVDAHLEGESGKGGSVGDVKAVAEIGGRLAGDGGVDLGGDCGDFRGVAIANGSVAERGRTGNPSSIIE